MTMLTSMNNEHDLTQMAVVKMIGQSWDGDSDISCNDSCIGDDNNKNDDNNNINSNDTVNKMIIIIDDKDNSNEDIEKN